MRVLLSSADNGRGFLTAFAQKEAAPVEADHVRSLGFSHSSKITNRCRLFLTCPSSVYGYLIIYFASPNSLYRFIRTDEFPMIRQPIGENKDHLHKSDPAETKKQGSKEKCLALGQPLFDPILRRRGNPKF